MDHHLSIEESLRFGWAKTRAHSKIIFQVLLTLFAVYIAQQMVTRVLSHTLDGAVAGVILYIAHIVLVIGFIFITLRIAQDKHATYQEIVPPVRMTIAYIGATILSGIVTMVPLIVALVVCVAAFTILPNMAATIVTAIVAAVGLLTAAYFGLRYALVQYAILEDFDIIKSLRTSARLTRGHKWRLVGFSITLCLLNILGALLLLVGLLVTIPVSLFAVAHVYVKLHEHNHAN